MDWFLLGLAAGLVLAGGLWLAFAPARLGVPVRHPASAPEGTVVKKPSLPGPAAGRIAATRLHLPAASAVSPVDPSTPAHPVAPQLSKSEPRRPQGVARTAPPVPVSKTAAGDEVRQVVVTPGMDARSIAAALQQAGVLDSGRFLAALQRTSMAGSLRPGIYRFRPGEDSLRIVLRLAQGLTQP
ncbi:MAG: hypothetical protein IMW99_05375 [Firmicutes bacterium]|nr:hypothetical protein [Bacillota bacterium]